MTASKIRAPGNNYIFPGKVLDEKREEKAYLIKAIEETTGRKIHKTEELFTFPKMKSINFHECIDHKPYFVLLVRLANDNIIVGYSEDELAKGEKAVKTNKGFIGSLTNKTFFTLKKNNPKAKVILYKEFFIEFGNSELKIKCEENKVSSNLGSANKYFNTGTNSNPKILFGNSEREAELKFYEVHQV